MSLIGGTSSARAAGWSSLPDVRPAPVESRAEDAERARLVDQLAPLQAELREAFREQFGGLWIDDDGTPHIATVGFAPKLLAAVTVADLQSQTKFETVKFSEYELQAVMEAVTLAIEADPSHGIDLEGADLGLIALSVQENAVIFNYRLATDPQRERISNRFGPAVTFTPTTQTFSNAACTARTNCGGPVRAGIQLYRNNSSPVGRSTACMSAFVIKDLVLPPNYSITSAGHCYNSSYHSRYHPTSTYLGSTAGIGSVYATGADVMRIPIPASQASNLMYLTSTASRSVTSSASLSGEVIGMQVCSSKLSGNSCGVLLSSNVCSDGGQICGLRHASGQYACSGDSGSPVYQPIASTTVRALGIIQGSSSGTYHCANGDVVGSSSVFSHIANAIPALGRYLVVTATP